MVTKEQVLQAAKQSTVEGALKELFPEHFELAKIEPFQCDKHCRQRLVYIGIADAPNHLREKCLVLSGDYDWDITEHSGRTILTPTKNKS